MIALQGNVLSQPPVSQLNERTKLLRPVTRHAPADGQDTQPLLSQQSGCEMLQVEKRIEANLMASGRLPQPVIQSHVQPELRIRKSGDEHRNSLIKRRLQDATLVFCRFG